MFRCGRLSPLATLAVIMADRSSGSGGGPIARLRAARRRVALFVAPESHRAKVVVLPALLVVVVVAAVLTTTVGLQAVPLTALSIPVVLGAFLLDRPALRVLIAATTIAAAAELADVGLEQARIGSVVVLAIIAAIAVELVRDRERLGLSVGRGESMLLELPGQLGPHGGAPAPPR